MALSKQSIAQARLTMALLNGRGVKELKTKSALYRTIEWVKFPYTRRFKISRPMYAQTQYDPILKYMLDMQWISEDRRKVGKFSFRYKYTITDTGKLIKESWQPDWVRSSCHRLVNR